MTPDDWPRSCPACGKGNGIDLGPFADETYVSRAWHDITGRCKGCNRHPYLIMSFDRDTGLFFLSNFYDPSPVKYLGETYPTVEHAYQAAKTKRKVERDHIRSQPTPRDAKRAGRSATLRPDWEEVKVRVMRKLLQQKFAIPELRAKLLATGHAFLQEGNWWGDEFWGVCKGKGKNMLGLLLMQVRQEVIQECAHGPSAQSGATTRP